MFNQDQIETLFRKAPGIAAVTMRNLAASSKFKDALDTEIGRMLFEDLISLLDEKFNLIVDGKETDEDKAIFRVCSIIGERWNRKLKGHIANCNKINKIIG